MDRSGAGRLMKSRAASFGEVCRVLAFTSVAAASAGCAADDEQASESLVDPCASLGAIDPTSLIDDFEDPDANLPMIDGRSGSWWWAGDGTAGASFEPEGDIVAELLPEARCDSRFALRVSGGGFDDWGALVGMSFAYAPDAEGHWGAVAHSASEHQGVTFWAKVGETAATGVNFALSGRVLGSAPDPCPEPEPAGDGCVESFGVPLSALTSEWKYYRVPFNGLATHPVSQLELDTDGLYSLTLSFPPAAVFDFWLDDVAFY